MGEDDKACVQKKNIPNLPSVKIYESTATEGI